MLLRLTLCEVRVSHSFTHQPGAFLPSAKPSHAVLSCKPMKRAWDVAIGDSTREVNGIVSKTSLATKASCHTLVSGFCVTQRRLRCRAPPHPWFNHAKAQWAFAPLSQATQEHFTSNTEKEHVNTRQISWSGFTADAKLTQLDLHRHPLHQPLHNCH